jgi:hypothetical protein
MFTLGCSFRVELQVAAPYVIIPNAVCVASRRKTA